MTSTEINSISQSRLIENGFSPKDAKETSQKNSLRSSNAANIRSQANPVFAFYGDNDDNFEDESRFVMFFVFPDGYEFSVLKFEDVVDREKLSTITGYVVDPDKLTKR